MIRIGWQAILNSYWQWPQARYSLRVLLILSLCNFLLLLLWWWPHHQTTLQLQQQHMRAQQRHDLATRHQEVVAAFHASKPLLNHLRQTTRQQGTLSQSAILRRVREQASRNGITIVTQSFQRLPKQADQQVRLSMEFRGSYGAVYAFFQTMVAQNTWLKIRELTLEQGQSHNHLIQGRTVLSFFTPPFDSDGDK
ncbi:MAG: hypothetical protein OEY38_15935 [Gammaproteobacteria bacterium]|nr:hypothetical protein [Gammaproteobacteria bacterium]